MAGLAALLQASGYNPVDSDSALLGVIGDPHIFLGAEYPQYRTDHWDDGLIAELNSLPPLLSDLVVAGDLISYHTMVPGLPRYPGQLAWARDEFRLAKAEIERFSRSMRIWAIPGNHDTDAFESNADLWREMLGIPAYQKTVLGGVPVFFLNSGNGGMLDPVQQAWFRSEAALIAPEQEVVVVVHHPCFFRQREQAAVKRVLTDVFGGRSGTVWVVSGHDHLFGDQQFLYRGTKFVQMMVTAANPKSAVDQKSPGYILLALQDGRVIKRLFRSLKDDSLVDKSQTLKAVPGGVKFQFDEIPYCAETFEEGFYDRTGRVVSYSGVDVGSYIAYCKNITFRVLPQDYSCKVAELILAGTIGSDITPVCSISLNGAVGTWESVPFPTTRGSGLFRITVPAAYRNAASYLVKIDTGLTASVTGFSLSGWALAADVAGMTGFEKWLYDRYGSLQKDDHTLAASVTPGSTLSNLVNFSFNLLPVAGAGSAISGLPQSSVTMQQVVDFRFARRMAESQPGIQYVIEESSDLNAWVPVEAARLRVAEVEPGWEELSVFSMLGRGRRVFHRVRIDRIAATGDGFGAWTQSVTVPTGRSGDCNANQLNDLVEYAFKLDQANGGGRSYDRQRLAGKMGLPVQAQRWAQATKIVYARMRAAANPGVSYRLEGSTDLATWEVSPAWQYREQVLRSDGDWEQVEVVAIQDEGPARTFRVAVTG